MDSNVYFQWCVKRSLAGSLPEDQNGAGWARIVFVYNIMVIDAGC